MCGEIMRPFFFFISFLPLSNLFYLFHLPSYSLGSDPLGSILGSHHAHPSRMHPSFGGSLGSEEGKLRERKKSAV